MVTLSLGCWFSPIAFSGKTPNSRTVTGTVIHPCCKFLCFHHPLSKTCKNHPLPLTSYTQNQQEIKITLVSRPAYRHACKISHKLIPFFPAIARASSSTETKIARSRCQADAGATSVNPKYQCLRVISARPVRIPLTGIFAGKLFQIWGRCKLPFICHGKFLSFVSGWGFDLRLWNILFVIETKFLILFGSVSVAG